ncbi:MAG: type IV pilus modification PilV family protein [Candidatus Acidiferrales bacterium]
MKRASGLKDCRQALRAAVRRFLRSAARNSAQAGQAGFSMVELLIAIVLLLVGVAAVAQLVPTAIQTNTRNRYDSTALILAQRQLELMTAQDVRAGFPAVGNNHYFFCVPPGDLDIDPNFGACPPPFSLAGTFAIYRLGLVNAAVGDITPREAGAALVPGNLEIDWSQNFAAITDGYKNRITVSESALVGGAGQGVGGAQYETRWNVFTIYANFNGFVRPVAKRFTISVRGGPPGVVQRPATLTTWVAWRED